MKFKINTSLNKASMSNVANLCMDDNLKFRLHSLSFTEYEGPSLIHSKFHKKSQPSIRGHIPRKKINLKYNKNKKTVESQAKVLTFKNYFIIIYVAKTISAINQKRKNTTCD